MIEQELMAIQRPEVLFPNDLKDANDKFKKLSFEWHPDRNKSPAAENVFAHISSLYDAVVKKIENGTFGFQSSLELNIQGGKTAVVNYSIKRSTELGSVYYGRNVLTYVINSEHRGIASNFALWCRTFPKPDFTTKEFVELRLPTLLDHFPISGGAYAVILKKPPMSVALIDIIEYFKGVLLPTSVAWIVNRSYSLIEYCHGMGITHNGLSPETLFIDPTSHHGFLLGGWGYACGIKEKMIALPPLSRRIASTTLVKEKLGNYQLDQELVRAVGRLCLGDLSGTSLRHNKDLPVPMVDFLNGSVGVDIFHDHKEWKKVLTKCFGEPKFVEMNLDISTILKD